MAKGAKVNTLEIEGEVFSGSEEGAKFIRLPWVKRQITEKLGFTPYNGTLNIRLDESNVSIKRSLLVEANPIQILPAEGFCPGACIKAAFMGQFECAIVIPMVKDYPENMLEIIASVKLRRKFKLRDGDTVKLVIKNVDKFRT